MNLGAPPDFKQLFESLPGLYLILRPDFSIAAVSDNYLKATLTQRDQIIGKGLFEVFPDNPDDATADGVSNLRASLFRVLEHKKADTMPIQKYDVRRPDGSFEEKHWSPVNTPLLNDAQEVILIIHQVADVTEMIKSRQEEVRQKQRAQESLRMNMQLRELSEYQQNILEEERARIAGKIQEQLGQKIKNIKLDLASITQKLNGTDIDIARRMTVLMEDLDKVIESVRKIGLEIRPSMLDQTGLIATIEWQLREFEKKTGIFTTLIATIQEPVLPEIVKTSLFRLVQESLTNVGKHSLAKTVVVNLEQQGADLIITVHDNGIGFDAAGKEAKKMLGILGMQERVAMIGGSCEISSRPGTGTTVLIKLAADWQEEAAAASLY